MSVHHYRGMLAQRFRMESFRKGIEEAVRPGDRVLEVGGGLCTYAMFAARAGAGRVWTVEGGGVRHVAQQVLRDNDMTDRVTLLEGWFPEVGPPEQVDLAIYEDFGPRLVDDKSWGVLDHIARACLAPGGRLFPNRARIWMAPVHSPRNADIVAPFGGAVDELYDLDWEASRDLAANTPVAMTLSPDEVVGPPRLLSDVTLLPPPRAADLGGDGSWTFPEGAVVDGLVYWFELEVGRDVWLTNAPGGAPGSWGHLFLPAARRLVVPPGGAMTASVGFDAGAEGQPGWMRWSLEAGGRKISAHEFRSLMTSGSELAEQSPDWCPTLTEPGQAALRILRLADGTRSMAELSTILLEEGLADTQGQAERLVQQTLAGRAL